MCCAYNPVFIFQTLNKYLPIKEIINHYVNFTNWTKKVAREKHKVYIYHTVKIISVKHS